MRRRELRSDLVPVSGFARSFVSGADIPDAKITAFDAKTEEVIDVCKTGRDGKFSIYLDVGRHVFFRIEKDKDSLLRGYRPTQTPTVIVPQSGINDPRGFLFDISFQVPSNLAFMLLAYIMWATENRECGQVAVTVTLPGITMDDIPQGEPGVEVFLCREGDESPLDHDVHYLGIIPGIHKTDFSGVFGRHQRTSLDGGVLFRNVPPGFYKLVAEKGDMRAEISVVVSPGVLTNASPARGLVLKPSETSTEYESLALS